MKANITKFYKNGNEYEFKSSNLATVATTGNYTDLIGAPQYVICTLSAYNAMVSHDSNVYYIIISESNA